MPLYFLPHPLSNTQKRWSAIEKEAFDVYALQKQDHYCHNAKFIIFNDHKPLQYILKSQIQKKELQITSALNVAGYDCKVEYLPCVYISPIKITQTTSDFKLLDIP